MAGVKTPRFMTGVIKEVVNRAIEAGDIEQMLSSVSQSLLSKISPKFIIASFNTDKDNLFVFTGEPANEAAILDVWKSLGLHEHVLHDLKDRYSAVSFSSYSWPYPSTREKGLVEVDGKPFYFPAMYSVLIPYSSSHVFSIDGDESFLGYFVVVYDDIPEMSDDIVQLAVALPEVVSALAASFLRLQKTK